jgi:hypothetical protein
MKKTEAVLLVLPVAALATFGYLRSKGDARVAERRAAPFRLTVASVTAEPKANSKAEHDVDVTVVIDHDGPTPRWWGSQANPGFIPNLQVGDTHLVDGGGKQYRQINFGTYRRGIYGMSKGFDDSRQSYVYVYRVYTAFIPVSVQRLTFKSKLVHPSGTNQVSVVVRDTR